MLGLFCCYTGAMTQYVALLRGINVGGNNIIKMADLKVCLVEAGFEDVATYIQSGNVLFASPETDVAKIDAKFMMAMGKSFGYKAPVMFRSHVQMKKIVHEAPKGFGTKPDEYRYDVLFVRDPLTAAEALSSITLREGVDAAAKGDDVLYFWRTIVGATKSHLNKIVGTPMYKNITIRNWNTTSKLLALMDERAKQ
jgi:uncharacterized protein (DUF1697 family)